MPFTEEPTGYEKTILSDLQGAWIVLRESVADTGGFEGWDRAIFHIDEAMSWETVRNLKRMPPLILIIRNICKQGNAPPEVLENIQEVDNILPESCTESAVKVNLPKNIFIRARNFLHTVKLQNVATS